MNSVEKRRNQRRRPGNGATPLSTASDAGMPKPKRRASLKTAVASYKEVVLKPNGIVPTNDENVSNGVKAKASVKKKRKQELKSFKPVEFKTLPRNALGTVFWAKTSGSPWWPARYCIPEEVAAFPELEDRTAKQATFAVFFFGSHDVGSVKEGSIIPYRDNYDFLIKRNKTTKFKLGIEEAEEMILKAKPPSNRCMICELDDGSITALICDRCNEEVHMSCLKPPLTEVPDGDWFCPRCKKEAPLTVQYSEDLWRKKGISARQPIPSPTNSQVEAQGTTDKKRMREVDEPQGIKKKAKSSAKAAELKDEDADDADSICFLCKLGGNLMLCDFKGCPRAYHCHCLGISEPAEDSHWKCPWHYCAHCSKEEDEATSVLHVKPWPNIQNLRRTTVSVDGKALEGLSSFSEEHPDRFARCMNCSLALCSEHTCSPRVLTNENGKLVEPVAVIRGINKSGFFKCCYCSFNVNTKDGTKKFTTPHTVVFSDILLKLWSSIVNHHYRLAEPFLEAPSLENQSSAVKSLVESGSPSSLSEIREKIVTYGYSSFEQLRGDFEHVGKVISAVFGSKDSMLEDLAYTLSILLGSARDRHRKKVRRLEVELESNGITAKDFAKAGKLSRTLNPSVAAFDKVVSKQKSRKKVKAAVVDEWAIRLAEGQVADNVQKFQKRKKSARSDGNGVIAALVAAVSSLEAEDEEQSKHQLPYSKAELESLLDKHASSLQSALADINMLKKAVIGNFNAIEATMDGDQVMTLGEMRVAAEYRLANNNLRAQVSRLKQMLSVEREARQLVEQKTKSWAAAAL